MSADDAPSTQASSWKVTVPTTASKSTAETAASSTEEKPAAKKSSASAKKTAGSTAKKAPARTSAARSKSTAKKSSDSADKAAPKKTGGRKKATDAVDEILAEVDQEETASPTEALENAVAKAEDSGEDAERIMKATSGENEEDESGTGRGFVISNADDDDAPAVQVVSAGATADPVKDYLKQIGKVALLNAEQEVDLALRIEAGLFAEHKLAHDSISNKRLKRDLELVVADGKKAKNHLLEANLRLVVSRRSVTPGAAFSSWT